MSEQVKRYAERDIMEMDLAGNYYCRHVSAMTAEGLHSKSDIAAELGFRDQRIDALHAEAEALRDQNRDLRIEADGWFSRVNGVEAKLYALRADLEEARGLLREVRQRCQLPDWARSQIDKLTDPQPGPDVRALVEALEVSVDYLDSNELNSIASGSTCHRKMRNALATITVTGLDLKAK